MAIVWNGWYWHLGLASLLAVGGAIAAKSDCALAQITPDGTLGAESSVVTPNVDINGLPSDQIDGGAIRGANLFHSFQVENENIEKKLKESAQNGSCCLAECSIEPCWSIFRFHFSENPQPVVILFVYHYIFTTTK